MVAARLICMVTPMDKPLDRVFDQLLVVRAQAGDRKAFKALFRRWQRRMWGYARRLTGHRDDAWDVTQEAWVTIVKRIKTLNDPAWFTAWAFRIVRNKCADVARRAGRERSAIETLTERCFVDERDSRPSIGADIVAEALWRLTPECRGLLALKYDAELSVLEIAVVLGVPTGTVKSRLYHAREALRRILEGDET